MADIRINALPTTASASSSDDYIALDGTTNGTRKLNAYSPTFGGNLTVSGGTITGGTSGLSLAAGGTNQNITLTPSGTGATVISKAETNTNAITTALNYIKIQNTSSGGTYIGALEFYTWDNRRAAGIFANRNNVDGTSGVLSFAYSTSGNSFAEGFRLNSTGNLLLGTTTDSGNGRLQLATHTTSAGGIGFGTDTSLYRTAAGAITVSSDGVSFTTFTPSGTYQQQIYRSGADAQFRLTRGGVRDWDLVGGSTFQIKGDGTTSLTLDSSQNATFAGSVRPNTTPSTAWGIDFASSTSANTYTALASNATYDLADGSGMLYLFDQNGAGLAQIALYYGATTIVWQSGSGYSTGAGTASKINVFYNAGTSKYRIENKTAGALSMWIGTVRLRPSN